MGKNFNGVLVQAKKQKKKRFSEEKKDLPTACEPLATTHGN